MKTLKPIFGNALVLAALLVAIAGSVLVAHAGREPEPAVQGAGHAAKAEEAAAGAVRWMDIPRGSFVDAML